MKYDLKTLETFIYVAQLKSFIRTAEALKIAKSHVTNRINQLEKLTGMTLLARTTREVNLTNEGREFLEYCKSIIDRVENLDDFLNKKKVLMESYVLCSHLILADIILFLIFQNSYRFIHH